MIYKSRRSYVKVENVGEWDGVEEQVEEILEDFRKEYRAKCFCVGYAEHLKKCQGNQGKKENMSEQQCGVGIMSFEKRNFGTLDQGYKLTQKGINGLLQNIAKTVTSP